MNETQLKEKIAPGFCATLWTPRAMGETLTPRVKRILIESRPQIVCLHGVPRSLEMEAKAVWGDLLVMAKKVDWAPRLWIGVACDTEIRSAALGYQTYQKAADRLISAAGVASYLDAELVCWNSEAASKKKPIQAGGIAYAVIDRTRDTYPHLVQAHTAYYAPTYHSEADVLHGYPWSAWCGLYGVDVDIPQFHVAPPESEDGYRPMASPGALKRAIQLHRKSWAIAQKSGWIRADLPVWMYGQLHHVPYGQTISYASDPLEADPGSVGAKGYVFAGWTVEKDRCDLHGEVVCRALSELARRQMTVRQFQKSCGFEEQDIDGLFGKKTAAAMDLKLPLL